MRFVTYNIQYSKGRDGSHDLGRTADAVDGADVICLQEVVRNVDRIPDRDQPSRLGDLLPRHYWVYGPCVNQDASTCDEDGTVHNRRRQFGNMVLSRWPILSSRLLLLPRVRTYDIASGQRGVLEAIVDAPPVRCGSTRCISATSTSGSALWRSATCSRCCSPFLEKGRRSPGLTGSDAGSRRLPPTSS